MFTKGTQTEDIDIVMVANTTLMDIDPLKSSGDSKEEENK